MWDNKCYPYTIPPTAGLTLLKPYGPHAGFPKYVVNAESAIQRVSP